jgi:nitrogen fixation/metabolism regulation signal transduction histidine kinase
LTQKMPISRFQLKLTLIFLLILVIPAITATLLTRYILTEEITGMYADERVEAVLQEAAEIAYNIIEEAEAECQYVADEISSSQEILVAFDSPETVKGIITDILPVGRHLSATVFDFRTDETKVNVSTSTDDQDVPYFIISGLKENPFPMSYQEGSDVYGVAPVLDGDALIGAVVVHQELDQGLVTNIIALQNFLKIYTLRQYVRGFTWIGMVVLFVLLAIGGAVLAALLARSVTRPILSLVAGTREVARGNLDHRVEAKGKDEIAVLVESFNSMVAQLKTSTERLLRAERLAAWRDVARRIAHEIKNPLTPIQLSMYRLRKNLGRERYDEIFQQSYDSITKEVDNLKNMVTEFSQFARMPKPRTSPSSPNDVVQDAINLYTGLPDNIVIHTELADNLPQVMVDRDQIRQVLHNLIGNAVDAMPDGGELSVRTHSEVGDIVTIEVSDTGCGMSEEIKQKIFTPYFTTKEKGTGLGMVITAQIVEEHEGEISVESQEGVGTRVTVKLKAGTESENAAES